MALNADILGTALDAKANEFNDQDIPEEDMPQVRRDFWKGVAQEIINHIKTSGQVNVNTVTSCGAGAGTGQGTGTIS